MSFFVSIFPFLLPAVLLKEVKTGIAVVPRVRSFIFNRQHCRLSICIYFGWVWQILRIWDEQACLMVVTIPAEIHNQWKEVSFGLPNSLGDDLFLGWAHGVLCPHISSPISFDGLADFSAVSGRGHYSARNTQSIKRSICWFVRPRGVTYRCVGPTTFCVLT